MSDIPKLELGHPDADERMRRIAERLQARIEELEAQLAASERARQVAEEALDQDAAIGSRMVTALATLIVKKQYCAPDKPCGNAGIHCLECTIKWAAQMAAEIEVSDEMP